MAGGILLSNVKTLGDVAGLTNIEKAYYISQIIFVVVSMIGIFFTLKYAKEQYENQQKYNKIAKAADLAKLYEESFINVISKITLKFRESEEAQRIIQKIECSNPKKFNIEECQRILEIEEMYIILNLFSENFTDDEGNNIISRTLNKMEYFCMYFSSGVADRDTVYQSLHFTFFKMVYYVYVLICQENIDEKNKLFTNIIAVFNDWNGIYQEKMRKEEEANQKIKKAEEDYQQHVTLMRQCKEESIVQKTTKI